MNMMTNRARQAEKTKKKIFKVGIDLLREKGFDDVNILDIVKKADVSVGTFYHYYDSKMDLFMDLYRDADEMFGSEVKEKISGKELKDAIMIFFNEYCNLVKRDGIDIVRKIYIPENHLFITDPRPMYTLLFDIVSEKNDNTREICDELFLIARGVVFDWALHDGSYNLHKKMEKMLNVYI